MQIGCLVLAAFTAFLIFPKNGYAQTYSTTEIVQFLPTFGGSRGPIQSHDNADWFADESYSMSQTGNIISITETFAQLLHQDVHSGAICRYSAVFVTTWNFDYRDIDPAVTIQGPPNNDWIMTLNTKNKAKLIRNVFSQQGADCGPRVDFLASTKHDDNELRLHFGSEDMAKRMQAMILSAWGSSTPH